MGGLIILLILIPLIFLILLISILSKANSQQSLLDSLDNRLRQLTDRLADLSAQLNENKVPERSFKTPPVKEFESPLVKKEQHPEESIPSRTETKKEGISETLHKLEQGLNIPIIEKDEKGWWSNWLEKNPDIEKFIGENLANKIGIAVLVLGIAFFVKYAIDKNWINEIVRIIIGISSGLALIGIAHKIHKKYRPFSSVLVGGGLSVLYFSIAFAFHQYHLINQSIAFAIMVVITTLAVILSIFYDRIELAVLATIGGFITPFLVTTGNENYIALFTYLSILNMGLIILSWFKRWPLINIIALFFTLIIFGGWLGKNIWFNQSAIFNYTNALFFASLFYIQFLTMNISNNLRRRKAFTAFDLITVFSVNFLYYTAGLSILEYGGHDVLKGLFTGILALFNFIICLVFFKTRFDKNFALLLLGITLTFTSLIAPVQLHGNYITIFWVIEAVILFWLFRLTKIRLLKNASLIIVLFAIGSLVINWTEVYFSSNYIISIVFNKGFITTVTVAAFLFIYYRLMKKMEDGITYLNGLPNKDVRGIMLGTSILIFYISGALEIFYQFNTRFPGIALYAIYLQLYSFSFAIILLRVFRKAVNYPALLFIFSIICYVLYILNLGNNSAVSYELILSGNYQSYFSAHWIASVLLILLLLNLIVSSRKKVFLSDYHIPIAWFTAAGLILLFSIEMYHLNFWVHFHPAETWKYWENLYYKAGLSILWSIISFVMMWLGMRTHFRTIRIISLTLFTITLAKLFMYDIRNIPPGGKIAAFIMLGVLLLIVSFMYQRLKKLIIEDALESTKNK